MTQKSNPGVIQRVVRAPGDFLAGAIYPLRAIALLQRSPQLLRYVVIPILVNLVLGVALYWGILVPAWTWIDQWSTGLPGDFSQWVATLPVWLNRWLSWLPTGATLIDDVLRWLLAAVLLVTLGLLLVQFGAIFGAPWYGSLAEQVEQNRLGQLPASSMSLGRALQDIGRAIAFQFKKLVLLAVISLSLLPFNFFPPLGNLISSTGWLALASLLVLMDFIDPPLERRRLSFRAKLGMVGRTFPASATFGAVCLTMVSIPFLNLLAVPLCIIAGTLFSCDYVLPRLNLEAPKLTPEAKE